MKYIDAEKLIAEIKRRLKSLHGWETKNKTYYRNLGKESAYDVVLSIISSLQQEQPEVDLEKEIEKYYYDRFAFMSSVHNPTLDILTDIAKHFYELGLNTRKEE